MQPVLSTGSRILAGAVLLLAIVGIQPYAQSNAPLRFEVASVKPYKGPLTMISSNTEPGGRFVAQQQSLRDLIGMAYKVRESQIIGGPSWIGSDRFDVNAKAARELLTEVVRQIPETSAWHHLAHLYLTLAQQR